MPPVRKTKVEAHYGERADVVRGGRMLQLTGRETPAVAMPSTTKERTSKAVKAPTTPKAKVDASPWRQTRTTPA